MQSEKGESRGSLGGVEERKHRLTAGKLKKSDGRKSAKQKESRNNRERELGFDGFEEIKTGRKSQGLWK